MQERSNGRSLANLKGIQGTPMENDRKIENEGILGFVR